MIERRMMKMKLSERIEKLLKVEGPLTVTEINSVLKRRIDDITNCLLDNPALFVCESNEIKNE